MVQFNIAYDWIETMTPTLDIDLLRSLVAFADNGSFTKAADVVGRTQSAVSMQMKRLEEMVGKPLFARQGRDLALTHDGERMVGYARRMLKLHEEAVASFAEPTLTGTVKVGIPDDYAVSVLPVLFSRFAESYPGVHLEVQCDSSDLLHPRVKAGTLDLGVLTEQDIAQGGRLLRQEPVVWATSRQHMTHRLDPLPLAVFPGTLHLSAMGDRQPGHAGPALSGGVFQPQHGGHLGGRVGRAGRHADRQEFDDAGNARPDRSGRFSAYA